MSIVRCDRCRRRLRNPEGWNVDLIAGLVIGHLCPDCQTPQEDLEAELNLITERSPDTLLQPDPNDPEAFFSELVHALVRTYPTPEVMRDKAGRLETARQDAQAAQMVGLMRELADDMASGDLWEVSA